MILITNRFTCYKCVYATIHNSLCIYYTASEILLTNTCDEKGDIVNPNSILCNTYAKLYNIVSSLTKSILFR